MDIKEVFRDYTEINIVFLGGSITKGAAASDKEKCFANMTGEWIREQLGQDRVRCYNKGVGGTPSKYGLLRLERDVIAHNPDLVFVEFAVNDDGNDTRLYVENIVRMLSCLPQKPYIVFIYTTDADYTTDTKYYEELGNYYGIPQISLKKALKERLHGKNAKEQGYLADDVHPNDKGHKVYYEKMIECLSDVNFFQKQNMQKPFITKECKIKTQFIPSEQVLRSPGWEINQYAGCQGLLAEKPGETLELTFEGNILAIEHGLHKDSGVYEIYIDDVFVAEKSPYFEGSVNNQLVLGFDTFELKEGKHTVRIVTKSAPAGGLRVLIYNFITGKSNHIVNA